MQQGNQNCENPVFMFTGADQPKVHRITCYQGKLPRADHSKFPRGFLDPTKFSETDRSQIDDPITRSTTAVSTVPIMDDDSSSISHQSVNDSSKTEVRHQSNCSCCHSLEDQEKELLISTVHCVCRIRNIVTASITIIQNYLLTMWNLFFAIEYQQEILAPDSIHIIHRYKDTKEYVNAMKDKHKRRQLKESSKILNTQTRFGEAEKNIQLVLDYAKSRMLAGTFAIIVIPGNSHHNTIEASQSSNQTKEMNTEKSSENNTETLFALACEAFVSCHSQSGHVNVQDFQAILKERLQLSPVIQNNEC